MLGVVVVLFGASLIVALCKASGRSTPTFVPEHDKEEVE